MTVLALTLAATALAWLLVFAGFDVALRKRWFSRFSSGFFVSILTAMIGMVLMSSSVVGMWGYGAATRMLDQELAVELTDVGSIIESQITQRITAVKATIGNVGSSVAPLVERGAPANELEARLRVVQTLMPRFLQLALYDRDGRLVAAAADKAAREEAGRVGIAFCLDGKPFVSDAQHSEVYGRQLIFIGLPVRTERGPAAVGVIAAWYDLQAELSDMVQAAKFNQSGYAVVVDGDGQVIAHPNRERLNTNVSSYPAVQLARQSEQADSVTAPNALGLMRLFGYRRMTNPATLAQRPWVLLTEINADEQLAPLRKLRRELVLGLVLVLIGGLIVAREVSRSIQQPMDALGAFADRIGSGDLTGRVALEGRDVAGRLASHLNSMTDGLEERDRVKEVFGRYVATQVSDKILSGQTNLGGESRRVTILFSDIRNFTGTAEQMTPVQVVTFLNDYFSEMVEAVFEQNGMLDKFLGDGLIAVFGVFDETPDHPRQAVLAALRMKALLAKINGERSMTGKPPIAIGIGIHTDEVIVGNIGSRKRLEFTVVGDGVNVSSRLQGLNKEFGTTILISETTHAALKEEFDCREMPSAQLRGRSREIKFFEVLSARGASRVETPQISTSPRARSSAV